MTRQINPFDALQTASDRVKELLAQESITERELESLTSHYAFLKANSDSIPADMLPAQSEVDSVTVIPFESITEE
jgi:hypothetical protein